MREADLRAGIRAALQSLNASTETAIRREFSEAIDLGHSERLQFEACPLFFGIKLVQTEEEIVPDSAISDVIPKELEANARDGDLDVFAGIEAVLPSWFADRWQAVDGAAHYRPAYFLFHGGMDEPRYDLEQRRWREVSEVWPDQH